MMKQATDQQHSIANRLFQVNRHSCFHTKHPTLNSTNKPGIWCVGDYEVSNKQCKPELKVKVKAKVKVYSLVSSAKRHLPDFTQLPPWSQLVS